MVEPVMCKLSQKCYALWFKREYGRGLLRETGEKWEQTSEDCESPPYCPQL